jgi:hypothetical protein
MATGGGSAATCLSLVRGCEGEGILTPRGVLRLVFD